VRAIIFIICTLAASFAQASIYTQGDTFTPIALQDQFEQSVALNTDSQILLFSRSMAGGDIIKEALTQLAAENQSPTQLVYIADISGMPSLIASFVAIPQMKELAFSIGLDKEGEVTKLFPQEDDKASLIKLDKLKIVEVMMFDSSDALLKALK